MNFSLADIFGRGPSQAQQAQPNQANPNVASQANPNPSNNPNNINPSVVPQANNVTAPNGMVPANSQQAAASPLDAFKDLWETPKVDPNAPQNTNQPLDPAKLMESAQKADFSKSFNPEMLAQVAAGGEGAVAAMLSLLQTATQTAYSNAVVGANKIFETRIAQVQESALSRIPDMVREQSTRQQLLQDNPAFANPAVAPIVDSIQRQLQLKYPKATPNELTSMAKEALAAAAGVFNPGATPQAQQNQSKPAQEDWSAYIGNGQIF